MPSVRVDPGALRAGRRVVHDLLCAEFSARLGPSVFSSSPREFEGARVAVELGDDWPLEHRTATVHAREWVSSFEYDGTSLIASWETGGASPELPEVLRTLTRQYIRFLLSPTPRPFILSAERFGISLFYKELDFTRNHLVDLLQQLGEDRGRTRISPFAMIDKTTNRYALPIKDNIDYTRSLSELRAGHGPLHEARLFDDIKDIMGGYYRVSDDTIRFKSKARKEGAFDLPLHLASSSARGLVDLYFYLRHVAMPDDLLLIDEPESHLDTGNQVLLARTLARMVGAGVRVLISHAQRLPDQGDQQSDHAPRPVAEGGSRVDALRILRRRCSGSHRCARLRGSGERIGRMRGRSVRNRYARIRRYDRPHQPGCRTNWQRVSPTVTPAGNDRTTMELNARLQDVLQKVAIEPQHRDCLRLIESQKTTPYEVTDIQQPLVVTAIRMNRLRHLARLNQGAWNKICDYLLITARDEGYCAVFVELKETLRENDDAREQLRRSLPILEYLRSVCAVEDLVKPDVSVRYVILASATRTGSTSSASGLLLRMPFERSTIGVSMSNRLSVRGFPSAA